MINQIIERSWYRTFSIVTALLLPLSILYCVLSGLRRGLYSAGILHKTRLPVPVIVVGNINVGGTGKTPLVIALVEHLKLKGFKPGIVSRGYGGHASSWPQMVTTDSTPREVGDEAMLLASHSDCPMSVGPERVKAAQQLLENYQCDIIVSDDGLQHLALQRDIEIVVIDSERRFGNGFCLPAGPLRELPSRLNQVDLVVSNGKAMENEFEMQLKPYVFVQVKDSNTTLAVSEMASRKVHAIAGIGNNERFFKTLENLNIAIERHPFVDHYDYQSADLQFDDDLTIIMTEKDAVKCKHFAPDNAWFLKVNAQLSSQFYQDLDNKLDKIN